jgi:transcriptional regulator with XRE-family HTH domain
MDIPALVRANMLRIRLERNLTQEVVAERLDMKQSQYSRLETSGTPTLTTLIRIAEVGLKCSIDELFIVPENLAVRKQVERIEALGPKRQAQLLRLIEEELTRSSKLSSKEVDERRKELKQARKG